MREPSGEKREQSSGFPVYGFKKIFICRTAHVLKINLNSTLVFDEIIMINI